MHGHFVSCGSDMMFPPYADVAPRVSCPLQKSKKHHVCSLPKDMQSRLLTKDHPELSICPPGWWFSYRTWKLDLSNWTRTVLHVTNACVKHVWYWCCPCTPTLQHQHLPKHQVDRCAWTQASTFAHKAPTFSVWMGVEWSDDMLKAISICIMYKFRSKQQHQEIQAFQYHINRIYQNSFQ